VEDSFKLLEDKVQRAAARLRELSSEADALRGQLRAAQARAEKAEAALGSGGERLAKVEAQAKALEGALRAAEERAQKAERDGKQAVVRAEGTVKTDGARLQKAEQAVEELRHEREEIRERLRRLAEALAGLE
jgi:chromosome segregation ATPase